jgi:hypothetical protein
MVTSCGVMPVLLVISRTCGSRFSVIRTVIVMVARHPG